MTGAPRRATTLVALVLVALVLVASLVAAACGNDDPVPSASGTSVPVVTTGTGAPVPSTTAAGNATDSGADTGEGGSADGPTTTAPDPRAVAGDVTRVTVGLEPLARLDSPIDAVTAPNGEFWVAQRGGTIVVLDPATGAVGATILDLSAETTTEAERGLLGLAVDDHHLYVDFTDRAGDTNVDAFTLDADGRPGARTNLLVVEQPFANHNGGGLAIGPDGHLYVGLGDGGSANDPLGAGQDPTQLLGSILRIDPTPGETAPYAVPDDNPWADGTGGRPEVFLIGVRNPWRFTFDPITGDLWIADVGQNQWEEIDLLLGANGWGRGANLGWNLREGTNEFTGPRPDGNVDPVFEYPHAGGDPTGCSITGGRVYRGLAVPDLVGAYVFADYCGSQLWAISVVTGVVQFEVLTDGVSRLVGIVEDPDGELLTLSLEGQVSRLVPA